MDCQQYLVYTIEVSKRKHAQRTGLFIGALMLLSVALFAFTQPMLAPGFDLRSLGASESEPTQVDATFDANPKELPIGTEVQAESFLVFDEQTGAIITAKNSTAPVAIASITKLMTAYVTQKYGNLEDEWAINSDSTNTIRPILGLQVGDRVLVKDLAQAMLIGSANDAASALGEYVSATSETPIIELMNKEASRLGMDSTHYENPIGFDSEQNYSTAEDLQLLLNAIRPISLFSSIDRNQSYNFTSKLGNSYSIKATNTLLASDPEIHAIKTGFTDEAGGAMITAVYHQDKKFVMIILGSPNREQDTLLLKRKVIEKLGK